MSGRECKPGRAQRSSLTAPECVFEREVLDAVTAGRWPNRCSEELRTHIAGCSICKDVALVAQALQDDYATAWHEARIPAPGLVWWRAELRARQQAIRTATRPIKVVEALAGACGAAVAAVLLGRLDIAALSTLVMGQTLPLVLGLGVFLILTPVALYFVLSE